MEQNIRLDVNHMMADMLGGEYGVTQAQLAAMQDAYRPAYYDRRRTVQRFGPDQSKRMA